MPIKHAIWTVCKEPKPLAITRLESEQLLEENSVCKPATPKWRQTVERLKEHFTMWKERG